MSKFLENLAITVITIVVTEVIDKINDSHE